MFRKHNGSLGFSFGRLMTNTIPNFATDGAGVVIEVSPQRRDMLYMHQVATATPECLNETSFYVAGVCDQERQSQKIHSALVENGVLLPDGKIDTNRITPQFVHQLAFISTAAQKNLINVLFLWEEELQRLQKLNDEEEELTTLITRAESQPEENVDKEHVDQMKFARERVRMKKRQR